MGRAVLPLGSAPAASRADGERPTSRPLQQRWPPAWLRSSRGGLVPLALAVGAVTGLGAIAFRWLILACTRVFSGHDDYAAAGHAANRDIAFLGPCFVVAVPVVAGLLYGPFIAVFAPEARGHGVPEVLYSIARRGSRIAGRVAVVKSIASAVCIGAGGSLGREGPIVQIGSAIGSSVGRRSGAAEGQVRLLVACGSAGGIAATFNAPLAGVFFAIELILAEFTAETAVLLVLSSVTATVVGRAAIGTAPQLHVPVPAAAHPAQYLAFAALGVLAGAAGIGFAHLLCWVEDGCDRVWRGPVWLRPAVGGLLLGVLLLALPEMYGVGDPVQSAAVRGAYGIGFAAVLLVGKAALASLTIGMGGSGGVFGPCLFIGAMLGSGFGQAVAGGPACALFALVGMGAVFAGASRGPVTSILIVFELTGAPTVILPLMAAVVPATLISRLIAPDTIYTIKLRRAGVGLEPPARPAGATQAPA